MHPLGGSRTAGHLQFMDYQVPLYTIYNSLAKHTARIQINNYSKTKGELLQLHAAPLTQFILNALQRSAARNYLTSYEGDNEQRRHNQDYRRRGGTVEKKTSLSAQQHRRHTHDN